MGRTSWPVSRILCPRQQSGPATIHLGPPLPAVSSGLPGSSGGPPSNAPCLTLLQVGFTEPPGSPRALVVSYTTVSPLPDAEASGGLFSVALSRGLPRVGVTHHLALWSPDFPRQDPKALPRPPGQLVHYGSILRSQSKYRTTATPGALLARTSPPV